MSITESIKQYKAEIDSVIKSWGGTCIDFSDRVDAVLNDGGIIR